MFDTYCAVNESETVIAFVSSILGMWSTLSAKMTKQENRNMVIEKDIDIKEISEVCKQKLRETVG